VANRKSVREAAYDFTVLEAADRRRRGTAISLLAITLNSAAAFCEGPALNRLLLGHYLAGRSVRPN
jgi:hypothetical protein